MRGREVQGGGRTASRIGSELPLVAMPTDEVRQESPWTMIFVDDNVICSESREQVEENLKTWSYALEQRRMKVSRRET